MGLCQVVHCSWRWSAASPQLACGHVPQAHPRRCRPTHPSKPKQEGQLRKDPRSTLPQWQPLLRPVVGSLNLEPDVSPLAEVRCVLWSTG